MDIFARVPCRQAVVTPHTAILAVSPPTNRVAASRLLWPEAADRCQAVTLETAVSPVRVARLLVSARTTRPVLDGVPLRLKVAVPAATNRRVAIVWPDALMAQITAPSRLSQISRLKWQPTPPQMRFTAPLDRHRHDYR